MNITQNLDEAMAAAATSLTTVAVVKEVVSGGGFGVLLTTGQNCHIPARLFREFQLREGDYIRGIVAPNATDDSERLQRTPWAVVFIDLAETRKLRTNVSQAGSLTVDPGAPVAPVAPVALNTQGELALTPAPESTPSTEYAYPHPLTPELLDKTESTRDTLREFIRQTLRGGDMWSAVALFREYAGIPDLQVNDNGPEVKRLYDLMKRTASAMRDAGEIASVQTTFRHTNGTMRQSRVMFVHDRFVVGRYPQAHMDV